MSSAVLQVDLSENASIVNQNEIQLAHHQVTIGHVWANQNVKESFVIVFDNLDHTKLFTPSCRNYLIPSTKNTVTLIKLFNVFIDGLTSQFNKCFSFPNLHGWKNEFNFKIVWNFFATSHGKGAVDGIGDTVQCSFWRNVCFTTAAPNNAVAYYELVKCINMGITIIYISSHTIQEKCAPRLPLWDNTLVVTDTMKLHCIKVRNSR